MAPKDFGGRVALVTGGGSGIGRATCLQLAREGARVLVTDVNLEEARHTLSLLPGGAEHLALQMNVTQQSDVEAVIEAAKDKFGETPSLLLNSAGITDHTSFVDAKIEMIDRLMDVNYKGAFIVSQVFTKALLEEKQEAEEGKGAIVNIISLLAKCALAGTGQYAASKGAFLAMTKNCAVELASKGIRVNSVMPGIIETTMTRPWMPQYLNTVLKPPTCPTARPGKPEEVAEVITFLLSERSSYIVGANVEITGGLGM